MAGMTGENFKCSYCGTKISDFSYICSNCGKVCKEKVEKMSAAKSKSQKKPEQRTEQAAAVTNATRQQAPVTQPARPSQTFTPQAVAPQAGASQAVASQAGPKPSPPARSHEKPSHEASSRPAQHPPKKEPRPRSVEPSGPVKINMMDGLTPPAGSGENFTFSGEMEGPDFDLNARSFLTPQAAAPPEKTLQPLKSSMKLLDDLVRNNERFVDQGKARQYSSAAQGGARLKLALLACMSPRMTRFQEDALGIECGDAFVIRVEGASFVERANSEVLRSLAIAVHKYGVEEILVLMHDDCGMTNTKIGDFIEMMRKNGVYRTNLDIFDLKTFFGGFAGVKEGVRKNVSFILNSGIVPETVAVHGAILNAATGRMEVVVNGYKERRIQ